MQFDSFILYLLDAIRTFAVIQSFVYLELNAAWEARSSSTSPARTSTGFWRKSAANLRMLSGQVAVNITVWRFLPRVIQMSLQRKTKKNKDKTYRAASFALQWDGACCPWVIRRWSCGFGVRSPYQAFRSWQAWQNVWIFTAFSCCTRSGTLCLLYHLHLLLLLKQNLLKCPNVVAMLCIKQTPTTHVFSVWGKICRNQGFLHVFYPQIWVSDPNIAKHWPRVSFVQNEVAYRFHVDCDWQTYICTSKWFLEQHIHSI